MAGCPTAPARWPSLVRADFTAVLAQPACAKSLHFALHHVAKSPQRKAFAGPSRPKGPESAEISTSAAPSQGSSVDILSDPESLPALLGHWLGLVVPKRHARRSVTRSLLKRQMRRQVARWGPTMPGGQWVMRLRAPFDSTAFPSASSSALQTAARLELDEMFVKAFGQ